MEKTVGAYEARRKFGQIIEEAFYKKDNFVVERAGRPMAVIVPIDSYRRWQRLARERVFIMLQEVWSRTADVPNEELEADIEQALKTLREELLAERGPQPSQAVPSP
ncbi:MAG: type II toxin-antitoxin system Phd/YefM family antitoxin [Acidobacteriota bacterium]